jgi:hypothetical protein
MIEGFRNAQETHRSGSIRSEAINEREVALGLLGRPAFGPLTLGLQLVRAVSYVVALLEKLFRQLAEGLALPQHSVRPVNNDAFLVRHVPNRSHRVERPCCLRSPRMRI